MGETESGTPERPTGARDAGQTTSSAHPPDSAPDEREIDQILADSFPASDTPPWTRSVAAAGRPRTPEK